MPTVTVSPKFQVVIPKQIRETLELEPGQTMRVLEYDNRIEFIPDRPISEMKGFLKGININFTRADDRV